ETQTRWKDIPFRVPEGVRMVKIDRVSGKRVFGGTPDNDVAKASVIWEAFKPDTEPRRTARAGEMTAKQAVIDALRRARGARGLPEGGGDEAPVEQDFLEEQGGIY
ncbi:MAG: hypothetical protein B7Y31_13610, partial [Novosphingobium sp. 16-62-11]